MTPSDKKLRELAERVTPVDWRFERHAPESQWAGNITAYFPRAENEIQQIVTITCQRKTTLAEAYGEFMEAACPKNILALLSEKEAAEASVAVLVEALKFYAADGSWQDDYAPDPASTPIPFTAAVYGDGGHRAKEALTNLPAAAQSHLEYVRGLERENAELKEEYRKLEILWKDACVGRDANDALWMSAEAKLKKAEADLAEARANARTPLTGTHERCNTCNGTKFRNNVCEYSGDTVCGFTRPDNCPIRQARSATSGEGES